MIARALVCLLFSAAALAQEPAERAYPAIDPAQRLEGKALAAALRAGGFVLFMRHARQVNPQPQDCTAAALAAEGQAQAAAVGASLRRLRIPVGDVRASTLCRAGITARLMDLGPVGETGDLLPSILPDVQGARRRLLAEPPKPGTNTLLVSHVQGGEQPADRMQLDLAEVIVFRPDGHGGSGAVARIRVEDWSALE
jgi:phosphohistidine phosphatase SixA